MPSASGPTDDAPAFRVIAVETDWLVVWKGAGVHTAPPGPRASRTPPRTPALLDLAAEAFPEVRAVRGRQPHEGGLIHRLDRGTSGLVLIARTGRGMETLSTLQNDDLILKEYVAYSPGAGKKLPAFPALPPLPPGGEPAPYLIESSFRAYGPGRAAVRPVFPPAGPVYRTLVRAVRTEGGLTRFSLEIRRGFRHQIRCHLAWRGFPLAGDLLYGGPLDGGPSCGDYGDHSGGCGNHSGDNGNHSGSCGNHSGSNGSHSGSNGSHSGSNGSHSGSNGNHSGSNGNHSGDNGNHSGDYGNHSGDNGNHSGSYGNHSGDYGAGARGIALYAVAIRFTDPRTGAEKEYRADPPPG